MNEIGYREASKRLLALIDEINESREPLHIVGEKSACVLIPENDWFAIIETLRLQKIPNMRDSIVKGMQTPVDKCSKNPGW